MSCWAKRSAVETSPGRVPCKCLLCNYVIARSECPCRAVAIPRKGSVRLRLFVAMAKGGVHGFTLILKCIYSKAFLFEMVAAARKMQILFCGIWYKTKSLEILTRNQKFSKKFRNCNQNVWQHLMLRIYCTRCPRKTTFFDIATALRRQCKVVFLTKTTQIYRICCPLWLSREMRQVL